MPYVFRLETLYRFMCLAAQRLAQSVLLSIEAFSVLCIITNSKCLLSVGFISAVEISKNVYLLFLHLKILNIFSGV